jgi:hypothetical protein
MRLTLRRGRQAARAELDLRDDGELTTALGRTFADDLEVLGERLLVLTDRFESLERRLIAAEAAAGLLPEHGDVLDVQVRAARLAAELHLVTLEVERLRTGA